MHDQSSRVSAWWLAPAVVLAAAMLVAVPRAWSQPAERVARIGVVVTAPIPSVFSFSVWREFFAGMRELGWIEGRNFQMEARFTEGRLERFPELTAELVRARVDVLIAGVCGAPLEAARRATQTIPIVVPTCNDDLVETGVVKSMNHPGGNITGLSKLTPELAPKRLQLLTQAVPGAKRVAVLWNPAYSDFKADWRELRAAASKLDITLLPVEFRNADEIEPAFGAIARERPDALIMFSDLLAYNLAARVAALARERRLPAMFPFRELVDAGGLMSYGPNLPAMWRRAASHVDRILKGAKAGDLPIEQPSRLEFVVSRKAAVELGLKLPQSLVLQADQAID